MARATLVGVTPGSALRDFAGMERELLPANKHRLIIYSGSKRKAFSAHADQVDGTGFLEVH
ncbi:MAG: hypothetical protein IKH52_01730, partial [Bacteroidaceae bacterium]|nr:hypothetical protein [Bacteroidaceae bacterium]